MPRTVEIKEQIPTDQATLSFRSGGIVGRLYGIDRQGAPMGVLIIQAPLIVNNFCMNPLQFKFRCAFYCESGFGMVQASVLRSGMLSDQNESKNL